MQTENCPGEIVYLEGSTLPYCRYEANGLVCYRFDSSREECPVPMTAALTGLKLIDGPDKRLIMINHTEPAGLFGRVGKSYKIQVFERKDGLYEIIFDYKEKAQKAALSGAVTCPK